jgi:hypothetical protein
MTIEHTTVFDQAAPDRWETGGYGGRPNKVLNGCYRVLRTRHSAISAEPLPAISTCHRRFQQCSGTGGSKVFADPGHELVERRGRDLRETPFDVSLAGQKESHCGKSVYWIFREVQLGRWSMQRMYD